MWLSATQHLRKDAAEPQAFFTGHMASLHLIERGANMFPAWLRDDGIGNDRNLPLPDTNTNATADGIRRLPNLSGAARPYLDRLGLGVEDLFPHVLATLHDPAYRKANAGALRMEWPRIPLPGWPDGVLGDGSPSVDGPSNASNVDAAAATLAASAARGASSPPCSISIPRFPA